MPRYFAYSKRCAGCPYLFFDREERHPLLPEPLRVYRCEFVPVYCARDAVEGRRRAVEVVDWGLYARNRECPLPDCGDYPDCPHLSPVSHPDADEAMCPVVKRHLRDAEMEG